MGFGLLWERSDCLDAGSLSCTRRAAPGDTLRLMTIMPQFVSSGITWEKSGDVAAQKAQIGTVIRNWTLSTRKEEKVGRTTSDRSLRAHCGFRYATS